MRVYFVYATDHLNFYLIFINDKLFETRMYTTFSTRLSAQGIVYNRVLDDYAVSLINKEPGMLEEIEIKLKETGLYEKAKNKQLTQNEADEIVRLTTEIIKKHANLNLYRHFEKAKCRSFDVAVLSC